MSHLSIIFARSNNSKAVTTTTSQQQHSNNTATHSNNTATIDNNTMDLNINTGKETYVTIIMHAPTASARGMRMRLDNYKDHM